MNIPRRITLYSSICPRCGFTKRMAAARRHIRRGSWLLDGVPSPAPAPVPATIRGGNSLIRSPSLNGNYPSTSHHSYHRPNQSGRTRIHTRSISMSFTPNSTPPQTTAKHHDLETFIANYQGSKTSTFFNGTNFEYRSLEALVKFTRIDGDGNKLPGMTLEHSGKANDGGIDIKGYWILKSPYQIVNDLKIDIIVQCKNYKEKKPGPDVLRNLNGIFKLKNDDQSHVLRILATPVVLTKAAIEFLRDCENPMMFVLVDKNLNIVRQATWNMAAEEIIGKFYDVRMENSQEPSKKHSKSVLTSVRPCNMN